MFQSPGPILVHLGPLAIRWYGLAIAGGFLASVYAAVRLARRWGIDSDKIVNGGLVAFIGGIVGARLYFVALSWPYFSLHPWEILATWHGGLSIHGGLAGGLAAGVIYCLWVKLPVLTACDIAGCVIGLGQAIGRWGNFFNNEAFGRPVPLNFPLKLYIPEEFRPLAYQNVEYFHAAFLYEAIWDATVFALLYFLLADRLKDKPGMLFLLYVAGYSTGRLIIEPIRTDSIIAFNIPVPVIASLVLIVVSLAGLAYLTIRYRSPSQSKAR